MAVPRVGVAPGRAQRQGVGRRVVVRVSCAVLGRDRPRRVVDEGLVGEVVVVEAELALHLLC